MPQRLPCDAVGDPSTKMIFHRRGPAVLKSSFESMYLELHECELQIDNMPSEISENNTTKVLRMG